ncbi:Protein kinase, ATP binding site domain-containing protein [Rozella allomycis CSF55]|uniref:non-specific serine/threonine protein kinase n=1 Tax=Rozella allomycis (strain CSF55) TaxID=988480 RepID=A0A075AWT8_ROZAC|nr:Protein kinase, ATP binding site domain-containing protein [Rozella allomycis CSF55]|eukprot:EPZ33024.1 Protein kinase, ATP binding site domain-containing protein [Rozella allomycis CSF55]
MLILAYIFVFAVCFVKAIDYDFSKVPICHGYDFTFIETLGEGSYGTVYRAVRKSDQLQVAFKVMKIQDTETRQQAADSAFLREIRALDLLRFSNFFPNLICMSPLNNAYVEKYYVMEYINGITLHRVQWQHRENKLSPQWQKIVFAKLIIALEEMRKVGLCHKDLSEANIMITGKNIVKIIDFGISEHVNDKAYFIPPMEKGLAKGPLLDYMTIARIMYKIHSSATAPYFYSEQSLKKYMDPCVELCDGLKVLSHPHIKFDMMFLNALKPLLLTVGTEHIENDAESIIFYLLTTPYFNDVDWTLVYLNEDFAISRVYSTDEYQSKRIEDELLVNQPLIPKFLYTMPMSILKNNLLSIRSKIDENFNKIEKLIEATKSLTLGNVSTSAVIALIEEFLSTAKKALEQNEAFLDCQRHHEKKISELYFKTSFADALDTHNKEVESHQKQVNR